MGARLSLGFLSLTCAGCLTMGLPKPWKIICHYAPYRLGQSIPQDALAAMYELAAFPTATEMNQRCQP